MKKYFAIPLILLLLLIIPFFHNFSTVSSETENVNYFLRSTVTYANPSGNTNVWDFTEEDRTISLFMNNTWQTVELLNSTFPMEAKEDEDGNPIAVLQFPNSTLNPGKNVSFTVWYRIISKQRIMPSINEDESHNLTDISPLLVLEYTREEGPWQTSDQALQELAANLKGGETRVLTIIKNFINWMKDPNHMKYPSGRHENPYYPSETYSRGEGDCDDQAILLVTLCRIVEIPSYLQVGCIYQPEHSDNISVWDGHVSLVQQQIAWHGWAVVYVPPWGWLPVDLTYIRSNRDDPLSSVRSGAVTEQDTIQYMNVTHTDYVATSFESRAFLTDNGFNVYVEDEMILDRGEQKLPTITVDPWLPIVFVALIAFFVATSFVIFRRLTREYQRNLHSRHS